MSYLPVLGPYQFATSDTVDCGCSGQPYCTPFANGDVIAFQIPASQSCCDAAIGCPELTASCISTNTFTSDLTYTQNTYNISFDDGTFSVDDWLLMGNTSIADSASYLICFCIRDNDTAINLTAKIGTVESTITVSGNGNFCLEVVNPNTTGSPAALDWGVVVKGGDDTVDLTMECMTLCTLKTFSADLVDDEDNVIISLTRNASEIGNQIFEASLSIPGEIEAGCYNIKLTNDCDDTIYYSQCLKIEASWDCNNFPNLLLKWRNSNNAFGFDYVTDTTYYNYLRVKAKLKHPTYPDDSEPFTKSDNNNVLTNARIQKVKKLVLDPLPEYIHDAIVTARRNSDFQIDGVNYVATSGEYIPNWRNSSELASVEVNVYVQDFDGLKTYCE